MSFQQANEPVCTATQGGIALKIEPRTKDLGEFNVRRVLPASQRRMVGPFIFFDHMGPAEFAPGQGIQVRPHPHIGIATITYLFEGEIVHRDSLGCLQTIRPGAVNLMVAGRGIVHSERAGDDLHSTASLHGIQSWIALPDDQQECDPSFTHFAAEALPLKDIDGARIRLIMGQAYGLTSPVPCTSPTLYAQAHLPASRRLALPEGWEELAFYVVAGNVICDGNAYAAGTMALLCAGSTATLAAEADSHVMVIGGAPVGERHIWWNFVSNSVARIDRAKQDCRAGRFAPVPDETEFIPLPDD